MKRITIATEKEQEAYAAKFDNLAEVAHPSIFCDPRFGQLLREAVSRGTPLTRPEVEAVFGEQGWEW